MVSSNDGTLAVSADGSVTVSGDSSKEGKRPEITLKFGNPSSFDIDFVVVHVRDIDPYRWFRC